MGWIFLIVIVIVLGMIGEIINRYPIILVIGMVVVGSVVTIVYAWKAIRAERAAEAERERLRQAGAEAEAEAERERRRQDEARRERLRQEKQSLQTDIASLCNGSLFLFEEMPKHLLNTEELIDQAERDFKEGVFSPFWDSIEKATMRLGNFDDNVRNIAANSNRHTLLASKLRKLRFPPPRFPIGVESVRGMAAANTTSDRIKRIVRKAQSNPDFAMIYEQRRTNQLLVAGFSSLAQALDGMGQRIASSIDNLGNQVSHMSSAINNLDETLQTANRENQELMKSIADNVDNLHSTTKKEALDQAERHERALNMLDNIQRRRTPYPHKYGDGTY